MFKYLDQLQKLQLASPLGPNGDLQEKEELFASTLSPIVAQKPYSLVEQCIRAILPNPLLARHINNLPLDIKQLILNFACDERKVVSQLYEVFYDPSIKSVNLSNTKFVNECITEMIKKTEVSNQPCSLEVLLVSWTSVDPNLICKVIFPKHLPNVKAD